MNIDAVLGIAIKIAACVFVLGYYCGKWNAEYAAWWHEEAHHYEEHDNES